MGEEKRYEEMGYKKAAVVIDEEEIKAWERYMEEHEKEEEKLRKEFEKKRRKRG